MVGMVILPCHQHHRHPGGPASGGSQKASSRAPLQELGATAGGCRGGTVRPVSRSCNSSSPPLNPLEELVWKFQPIFKGYFHSSEIYQRKEGYFYSAQQLPVAMAAGRAKCNKASLCYRKHKGNHGHHKERRLSWEEEGNTGVRSPRPGIYLGLGSFTPGDFMGSSVPIGDLGDKRSEVL